MKKNIFIITSFSLLIDQISKYIVGYYEFNFSLIRNFLSFIYTKNEGIAFSMFAGKKILIILSSVVLLLILFSFLKKDYLSKNKDNILLDIGYGILFGGILGNLIDRIIRGAVVDFISLKLFNYYFPIFNLADLFITCGVIILLINNFKKEDKLENKNS